MAGKKPAGKKAPAKQGSKRGARKKEGYFRINEGAFLNNELFNSPEEKATRQAYGETLVELGKARQDVVVLTADLTESTRTDLFAKAHPDRFFNVGIAEQNMLAISAGLALSGKLPFPSTFGVFATGRAWDQLRTSVCYAKANVKLVATHTGVTVGEDGATHQALNDIAVTRSIPHLTIIVPADYEQTKKAILAAAEMHGPVYVRLGRPKLPVVTTTYTPFKLGKADWYTNEECDVAIIATGELVYEALVAAKKLGEHKIRAGVLNVHTIKPLDEEAIQQAAKAKLVITAEDHHIIGGLGSAVSEVIAGMRYGEKPRVIRIGVADIFGRSGNAKELMKRFNITSDDIIEAALRSTRESSPHI